MKTAKPSFNRWIEDSSVNKPPAALAVAGPAGLGHR